MPILFRTIQVRIWFVESGQATTLITIPLVGLEYADRLRIRRKNQRSVAGEATSDASNRINAVAAAEDSRAPAVAEEDVDASTTAEQATTTNPSAMVEAELVQPAVAEEIAPKPEPSATSGRIARVVAALVVVVILAVAVVWGVQQGNTTDNVLAHTRPFTSTEELQQAVDGYIAANNSPNPETSAVAIKYGFPIGTRTETSRCVVSHSKFV